MLWSILKINKMERTEDSNKTKETHFLALINWYRKQRNIEPTDDSSHQNGDGVECRCESGI